MEATHVHLLLGYMSCTTIYPKSSAIICNVWDLLRNSDIKAVIEVVFIAFNTTHPPPPDPCPNTHSLAKLTFILCSSARFYSINVGRVYTKNHIYMESRWNPFYEWKKDERKRYIAETAMETRIFVFCPHPYGGRFGCGYLIHNMMMKRGRMDEYGQKGHGLCVSLPHII